MPYVNLDLTPRILLENIHFVDHVGLGNLIQDFNLQVFFTPYVICRITTWGDKGSASTVEYQSIPLQIPVCGLPL